MEGFILGKAGLVELRLDAKNLFGPLLANLGQLTYFRLPSSANLLLSLLHTERLLFSLLDLEVEILLRVHLLISQIKHLLLDLCHQRGDLK